MKLNYNRERVAKARDLRLRWYNGKKIDRIPFTYTVKSEKTGGWKQGNPYNFREMVTDSRKAVEGFIMEFQHQFDSFPDCDYLPYFYPAYFGEGILASMYGAEQYIVEDSPPFTKGRIFKDIYEAQRINNDFSAEETEWGKKLKEHIERFIEATDGEIPVGIADYQSPYGTATKLMPNEELMMAMYDEPELVHRFLSLVTDGIIKLIETMERWTGPEILARNVTNPIPGECGIILWDDYISVLNPALHTEFCMPCNKRLYERFGKGHLHTCGPYFPGFIDACFACEPISLNTNMMRGQSKSREDLLAFLELTSRKNIRLLGGLTVNEKSIFEKGTHEADDELLAAYIKSGCYMPTRTGNYEDGLKFRETI